MYKQHFQKCSYLFCIIVTNAIFESILAEHEECERIVIEGGTHALKKIFVDFSEMKTAINELKSSIHECRSINETTLKELPLLDMRYDSLPKECVKEILPKDCGAATACTQRSGIYKIRNHHYSLDPFYVECDADTENGDWLLIQRRHDGSEDFLRDWEDYEKGFGDIDGEFFIGLKKLYTLTNYNGPQELLILMEDVNSTKAYAKYDTFAIANDTELYKLKKLGKFTGTAGDSFKVHLGMRFSTKDRDNDTHATLNCAANFSGAWWYAACHNSNLNGKFGDNAHGKGINWKSYSGHNASLKYVKMMIRRRRNSS